MSGPWSALLPSYTVPGVLPPRPPLCGHVAGSDLGGWDTDCDERALFIRTTDDGRHEYACAEHAAA